MRVIVEQLVEWRLAGETEVLRENLLQRHFVHHKIPHDQTRARTLDRRREKLVIKRMSYGAASNFMLAAICVVLESKYTETKHSGLVLRIVYAYKKQRPLLLWIKSVFYSISKINGRQFHTNINKTLKENLSYLWQNFNRVVRYILFLYLVLCFWIHLFQSL
jgi:hypothetical protein